MIENIIYTYGQALFIYFIVVNLFYMLMILISWGSLDRFVKNIRSDITPAGEYTKPISVIVPCYNEEETILDNLKSLLDLDYPNFEIVIVNDGSKDNTLKKIISAYNLRNIDMEVNIQIPCSEILGVYSSFEHPDLKVVDKINGGKADALNAGINASRFPLFCAIDADCIIEKDALFRIVRPYLKYEETVAVGGMVRIANGCTIKNGVLVKSEIPNKLIEKFQIIEYFRAFLSSRIGWQSLNALLIISGAFGLFKKSAVVEVGGYIKTIGEDMELTARIHEKFREKKIPYRIDFTSDAVCWTQAPNHLKDLKTQRVRWHRGLADSLFRHKKMFLNPRYGFVGMLSMPYFVMVELFGPIFEMIGYLLLIFSIVAGVSNINIIYTFILAYLFGILFSFSAIFLEEISYSRYKKPSEISSLFTIALFEQFGYRQLTVFWRFAAFFNYRKNKHSWGSIKRSSLSKED
ncbi:MAG: glycosyltransferase family 2 protein [Proteocatella sp.]